MMENDTKSITREEEEEQEQEEEEEEEEEGSTSKKSDGESTNPGFGAGQFSVLPSHHTTIS